MIILKEKTKFEREESLPELYRSCAIRFKMCCNSNIEFTFRPIHSKWDLYQNPALNNYIEELLKQVKPMDEEWKENIKDKWWMKRQPSINSEEYKLHDPNLFKLRAKLMSFGGEAVCLPDKDPCIQKVLRYGQLWIQDQVYCTPMVDNQCYINSLLLTEGDNSDLYMCTGYALSDDGMWREHGWVIDKKNGNIVETTTKRVLYYGCVMNSIERERLLQIIIPKSDI